MAFVNAGIKEIYINAGGADFSMPGAIGMGIRGNGTFIAEHINEMRDKDNRMFPSMINFRVEVPTMQIEDDALFNMLINGAKSSSLACAVVTSGVVESPTNTVKSPTGGIYLFGGTSGVNNLGVDFELNFTQNERTMALTLERAFKYDGAASPAANTANWIIQQGKTNLLNVSGYTLPDIDIALVPSGFKNPADMSNMIPTNLSAYFGDLMLKEFALTIRTVGAKSGFNVSWLRGIEVDFAITAAGGDADAMFYIAQHAFNTSAITVNIGTTYTLTFQPYGLTRYGTFSIGDEERTQTLMYNGTYDLDYVDTSNATIVDFKTYFT